MRRFVFIAALAALGSLLSPRAALSQTLSDLRSEARRAMRDTNTSVPIFTDNQYNTYLNEAQRTVVASSWCIEKSTQVTLTAATTFYRLPTDLMAIQHVTYARLSSTKTLEETTKNRIYQDTPDWQKQAGEPTKYFVFQDTDYDALQIAYSMIPTTASTGTVKIYYSAIATDLSADSDVPFEGYNHLYPYHSVLAYHAIAKMKMLKGQYEEAKYYFELYSQGLELMTKRLGELPNYYPGARVYTRPPSR